MARLALPSLTFPRAQLPSSADVVVVGAGPAGATTALLLARAGWQVVLLDRARFPRPKPCAEYVGPGVPLLLSRLGLARVLEGLPGCPVRGMRLVTRDGTSHVLSYGTPQKPLYGATLPRTDFDAGLVAAAASEGVQVYEGAAVVDVARGAGVVSGVVVQPGPHAFEEVSARLVVAADGLHSTVVRVLGLARPVRFPRRLGLVAHLAGVPWTEDVGEMHVGPRGYAGVAPAGPGRVSLGLARPLPPGRLGSPVAALQAALRDYPALARRLADSHLVGPVRGVGPLAHRVRACAGPGFLLVGDAAGFLDPFTGEGIYRALRGGEVAAQAADAALRRPTTPVCVSPAYEGLRAEAFSAKQRLTFLVQLFLLRPALFRYALAHLAARPEIALSLGNALGDVQPASTVLTPRFLAALLRP